MLPVIDIRSYQLHDGMAERFHHTLHARSLPLLEAAGSDVLAAMPSLEDPRACIIVRADASRAQRQASQDAFYGGAAWIEGPRAAIMACIASYRTIVMDADPALPASLRRLPA